jgi:signal transduction histidine kinase
MDAILSTIPGLVLAIGEGFEVIAAFGSSWKDIKINEAEIRGLNFSKIRHTPFRIRHIAECRESGTSLTMVVPLLGRQFECIYSRVQDKTSGKWIIVCLANDKTAEMTLDQVAIDKNFELAAMARNRSIEDLASSMAHEINNPLMIIAGSASSILKLLSLGTLTTESGQRYFDSISKNVFRISRIVRGVWKSTDDEALPPLELCSIDTLAVNSVEKVKAMVDCQAIIFKFENLDQSAKVLVRKDQIIEAIEQLLLNSIEAVRNSEDKWISLEFERLDKKYCLAVVDSGVGIPRDVRYRVMRPLFTTKEVGAGVGLGLTIARSNIESSGGRFAIDMNSKNTRFVIEFPEPA